MFVFNSIKNYTCPLAYQLSEWLETNYINNKYQIEENKAIKIKSLISNKNNNTVLTKNYQISKLFSILGISTAVTTQL